MLFSLKIECVSVKYKPMPSYTNEREPGPVRWMAVPQIISLEKVELGLSQSQPHVSA